MAKRKRGTDPKPRRIVTDVSPESYERLLAYIERQTWKPSVADVLRVAVDRLLDDEKKGDGAK